MSAKADASAESANREMAEANRHLKAIVIVAEWEGIQSDFVANMIAGAVIRQAAEAALAAAEKSRGKAWAMTAYLDATAR